MSKRKEFKLVIFEPVLLTIIALIAFQSYWLWKSYKEEKSSMQHRGDVLFKETIYEAHAEKLQLDTNIHLRIPNKSDAAGFVNVLKSQVRDSMNHVKSVTIVSMNKRKEKLSKDTGRNIRIVFSPDDDELRNEKEMAQFTPQDGLVRILRGVDSLEDSLTVKDISARFQLALKNENLPLSFSVTRHAAAAGERIRMPFPGMENASEVTLGFTRPITYRVEFADNGSYLLKKLLPQIMVSLLLVGITLLSFLLMQRNLNRQYKLTELKNDFISNITHELKTPIATVSVAIEAMKNFNALDNPERAKEYLDISGNELQRLSLLVDKVLRISMFEKKEIELKQEWFDMRALADEIVSSMRLQFEKYQAKVSVDSSHNPMNIYADKMHFTSVLYNLLDNALKYSKADPSIHVQLAEESGYWTVEVTDNGTGIPAEYKDKIFDKFFRVPTGDKHNVKGYGLGLSYVAHVVQRHNGSISVESQPGIGSKFIVKIPVQKV